MDESQIKNPPDEVVRGTVEQTLNGLLDAEADQFCKAKKHERSEERADYRSGHRN